MVGHVDRLVTRYYDGKKKAHPYPHFLFGDKNFEELGGGFLP
jgi:hypothetical protein